MPERVASRRVKSSVLRTVRWSVGAKRTSATMAAPVHVRAPPTLSPRQNVRRCSKSSTLPSRDLPPKQVVPRLADEGRYIGSESTIYRILRAEGQDAHRGRAKPRTVRSVDEHVATARNQVWSWDISAPG
jgi:putative transposase